MGFHQRSPKDSNQQIAGNGLLHRESHNGTFYVTLPITTSEEQHASKTLCRLNRELEQSAPPSESRIARIPTIPGAFEWLHASQVAAWSASQIAENKQSVLRHASLPCGTLPNQVSECGLRQLRGESRTRRGIPRLAGPFSVRPHLARLASE